MGGAYRRWFSQSPSTSGQVCSHSWGIGVFPADFWHSAADPVGDAIPGSTINRRYKLVNAAAFLGGARAWVLTLAERFDDTHLAAAIGACLT